MNHPLRADPRQDVGAGFRRRDLRQLRILTQFDTNFSELLFKFNPLLHFFFQFLNQISLFGIFSLHQTNLTCMLPFTKQVHSKCQVTGRPPFVWWTAEMTLQQSSIFYNGNPLLMLCVRPRVCACVCVCVSMCGWACMSVCSKSGLAQTRH